ncbi:hypothetical protein BGZ79_005246, partial [Entomortierella chlamydospora]
MSAVFGLAYEVTDTRLASVIRRGWCPDTRRLKAIANTPSQASSLNQRRDYSKSCSPEDKAILFRPILII